MIRTLEPAVGELDAVLALVLGDPTTSRRALRERVAAVKEYIAAGGVRCVAFTAADARERAAAALLLLVPGRTALLMIAEPGTAETAGAGQLAVINAALDWLAPQGPHYVQALVETDGAGRRRCLEQAGFRRLATLLYLERDATYPWLDVPPDTVTWRAYQESAHAEFAAAVLETYRESQDCPAVAGLRPIDDVLASHRAAGHWDASLWELAVLAGVPIGCLLMSVLPSGLLEVVYMGVAPDHRGRGAGAWLLRRALQRARERRCRRVTLVVDASNTPARTLYARFGFQSAAQRDAFFWRQIERSAPPNL